jgi:hypothetical protein
MRFKRETFLLPKTRPRPLSITCKTAKGTGKHLSSSTRTRRPERTFKLCRPRLHRATSKQPRMRLRPSKLTFTASGARTITTERPTMGTPLMADRIPLPPPLFPLLLSVLPLPLPVFPNPLPVRRRNKSPRRWTQSPNGSGQLRAVPSTPSRTG